MEVYRWQQNGLNFSARQNMRNLWLVWCSFEPLIADSPLHESPLSEIWFEYGKTKEDAIAVLLRELG